VHSVWSRSTVCKYVLCDIAQYTGSHVAVHVTVHTSVGSLSATNAFPSTSLKVVRLRNLSVKSFRLQ
jgi:hypothetical protein